jgi:hypothetical protein
MAHDHGTRRVLQGSVYPAGAGAAALLFVALLARDLR